MNAAHLAGALTYLAALPTRPEDRGRLEKPTQLMAIAWAATEASEGHPRLLALLLSTGFFESGYALRIHAGYCHVTECDHGRARGPWQTWQNGMAAEDWAHMTGVENTAAQVRVAVGRLAWGLRTCRTLRGAMAVYMGLGCDARSPHLDLRYREYERALGVVLGGKRP